MAGLDPAISLTQGQMRGPRSCIVIPAKAGIQLALANARSWTPACAGVTSGGVRHGWA